MAGICGLTVLSQSAVTRALIVDAHAGNQMASNFERHLQQSGLCMARVWANGSSISRHPAYNAPHIELTRQVDQNRTPPGELGTRE